MLLTSLNRVLISLYPDDPVATTTMEFRRRFINSIAMMSMRIQTYLDRSLELQSYTEYFDVLDQQLNFFVKAAPISSITSVKSDSTGEFTGSETDESNYYIGQNSLSVILDTPVTQARRGLQVIYTGGMANHGVNSVYEITSETGTLAAGDYVQGRTSLAVGIITSRSSDAITVENLYGIFQVDEIIDKKNTESGSVTSTDYATIDSVTSRGLAESYPDIVNATELAIRYYDSHRNDFENQSTIKGQTSRRNISDRSEGGFPDEVIHLLDPYRRITI